MEDSEIDSLLRWMDQSYVSSYDKAVRGKNRVETGWGMMPTELLVRSTALIELACIERGIPIPRLQPIKKQTSQTCESKKQPQRRQLRGSRTFRSQK